MVIWHTLYNYITFVLLVPFKWVRPTSYCTIVLLRLLSFSTASCWQLFNLLWLSRILLNSLPILTVVFLFSWGLIVSLSLLCLVVSPLPSAPRYLLLTNILLHLIRTMVEFCYIQNVTVMILMA